MNARPDMMTADEVAREMGYADRSAVAKRVDRGDLRLAACRLPGRCRRSWSRARLEAAGFLTAAAPPPAPAVANVTFPAQVVATWRVA